jgi:hypothetical protein
LGQNISHRHRQKLVFLQKMIALKKLSLPNDAEVGGTGANKNNVLMWSVIFHLLYHFMAQSTYAQHGH